MEMPVRIILADDHLLLREGTRQVLEQQPDFSVVGEATDGVQALQMITDLQPDVAILDIRMPGLNAMEISRLLRDRQVLTRVVILSAYDDDDLVLDAIEAGAQGYLLKTVRSTELVGAVRAVARDEMAFHPVIAGKMARLLRRRQTPAGGADPDGLTPRETEVLHLASRGLRNRDIAESLGVSTRTVEAHFGSILGKLRVTSRTAAVMYAVAHGLLAGLPAEAER